MKFILEVAKWVLATKQSEKRSFVFLPYLLLDVAFFVSFTLRCFQTVGDHISIGDPNAFDRHGSRA
jgi:hypothetical protein